MYNEQWYISLLYGLSKQQFQQILQSTPSITHRYRKKAGTALATVLTKLHTGESNERLSTILI